MIFDVWTILNPILRTFIYFSVLTTIGTILFSLHFSNFFDNIVKVYCQNLIKKFSIFGLFISLLVFLSVAGNLGGDFQSIIDISVSGTEGIINIIAVAVLGRRGWCGRLVLQNYFFLLLNDLLLGHLLMSLCHDI